MTTWEITKEQAEINAKERRAESSRRAEDAKLALLKRDITTVIAFAAGWLLMHVLTK